MRTKWSGDNSYHLPARQMEPYRLWYEFVRQAHRDSELNVDYEFYREWGDIWGKSFNDWWEEGTWRTLFAVSAKVRVLDERQAIKNDQQSIIVSLPLGKEISETLRDVKELLEGYNAGKVLASAPQVRFSLSDGYEKAFLKYTDRANLMLRLYRTWLDNAAFDKQGRINKTAVEFYTWAKDRDEMIRENNYKLARPMFPFSIRTFAEALIAGEDTAGSNERRQFMRYLQKARSLARNAARGEFPGRY